MNQTSDCIDPVQIMSRKGGAATSSGGGGRANTKKELDCAITLGELRFRANFYKTLNGLAAVFRRIQTKISSMDSLGLPAVLHELIDAHKGLVLVTGPTGSGKSTTLV